MMAMSGQNGTAGVTKVASGTLRGVFAGNSLCYRFPPPNASTLIDLLVGDASGARGTRQPVSADFPS